MIGEIAVLLDLLLMEINIIKIKGAEKVYMQKLTKLLFELLAIILEKGRGLYIPGFYRHRESVLILMIRDYYIYK